VVEPDEELGEEQQAVKVPKAPDTPTLRDVEEHEATGYVAHRSWCTHCARARAMESQHRTAPQEAENAVPTNVVGHMFMGQDEFSMKEGGLKATAPQEAENAVPTNVVGHMFMGQDESFVKDGGLTTSDGYAELRGLPWKLRPEHREALEQPLPIDLPQVDRPMTDPRIGRPGPRRLYIRRKDLEQHGVTVGCEGCESLINGGAQRTHTEECRDRIREELLKTEEGQARADAAEQRLKGAIGDVFVETRPDADTGEVIASEATGAPLVQTSGSGQKRGQPEPQLEKRARREEPPARGTKRGADETQEPLDAERTSTRARASTDSVSAQPQGTSSSSGVASALGMILEERDRGDIAEWLSALGCPKDQRMPRFAMDCGPSVLSDGEKEHPDLRKAIEQEDPYVLIVNSPCLAHEALRSSRTSKTKEQVTEQIRASVDMCVFQHERNRTFLLEIPAGEVALDREGFEKI
jgi:hypothetical protein